MTSILITLIIISIVIFNIYRMMYKKNKNSSGCGYGCSSCNCEPNTDIKKLDTEDKNN